ncbi:hypothetical protein ACTFIV_006903 [Dictyostelium citrinum]
MRLVKKNVIINGIYEAGVRYPEPANISYLWNFGFFSLVCLIIQLVSGILLAMHYSAHVDLAFNSIERLVREVDFGWLLRYVHANGASFFFIVVYVHMLRGLYFGSYQKPNAMLWVSGVVIFLLLIITGFLGYVLPWGQMSYWAATVITNLVTVIPVVGEDIVIWLWGGFNVDNPTLNRFFSLHYLCPFIIVGLVGLHIIFLRENGSTNPLGVKSNVDQIPFTPYFTIKDLFSFMIFLVLFFAFVFFAPNYLGHPDNYLMADSNVTPAHIVPEWYLLPFYAMLRSIPNKVLGVLALVLAIVVLAFLPFLTISEVRSSYFRKIHKHLFWSFLALCFFLGFLGSQPAAAPYLTCGLYSTILYFVYILVLFPYIYMVEKVIIKSLIIGLIAKEEIALNEELIIAISFMITIAVIRFAAKDSTNGMCTDRSVNQENNFTFNGKNAVEFVSSTLVFSKMKQKTAQTESKVELKETVDFETDSSLLSITPISIKATNFSNGTLSSYSTNVLNVLGLSIILFFLGYFLMFKVAYEDKLMGYECGFDPFGNARGEFDIRFYLVAILFLIFDLEITFLFPFSVSIMSMTLFSYSIMLIFLIILTIGFIYEIKKGALDWS